MRKILLVFIILISILLTACWDMVEINNRIYPYSVGFDMDGKEEKYNITYSYPNINALGKNPTSQEKAFVVSTKADNLFHAMHHLSTRISYPLDLKHLKVIILTEEVIKDDKLVKEIVDGVIRDFIANKNAQLLVATDGAEKLLQGTLKAKEQEIVGGTIYNLLLNNQGSSFFTPITMGNFVEDIDMSGSAIIPLGYFMDDAIHIEGGAVIKENKLAGYLTPKENRAIAYLNNKVKSDGVNVDYDGTKLSLMISESKTKKKLISRDENIKIQLNLQMEGHIHSFIHGPGGHIHTLEDNQKLERAAEKVAEKELQAAVDKVQKDLKSDVLFIGSYLDKFHHKLWKDIEKDWDEIYPEIDIDVKVDVKIRRRGLIK
ncbi:Ger(x)C family spore germination protein [Tissierella creatinini]|nr:Ger(x)C family spore germination protein [Tissierella creatinini]TJX60876.1 Ger(x)C family spore germination protein [Soehngenia saccharolytica]